MRNLDTAGLDFQAERKPSFADLRLMTDISWIVGSQVRSNKRYAAAAERGFAVEEVARNVKNDIGEIDIIVHSLANGPEVKKPLLETSRQARCSALLPLSSPVWMLVCWTGPPVCPLTAAASHLGGMSHNRRRDGLWPLMEEQSLLPECTHAVGSKHAGWRSSGHPNHHTPAHRSCILIPCEDRCL